MADVVEMSPGSGPDSPMTFRSRRSCENCRRKKTRCNGQKPTCALCARLKQRCFYARQNRRVGSMGGAKDAESVEDSRASVATDASYHLPELRSRSSSPAAPRLRQVHVETPASYQSSSVPATSALYPERSLPTSVITEGFEVYRQRFTNNPCPLFGQLDIQPWSTSKQLPTILLCPLLAISLRISPLSWYRDEKERLEVSAWLSQRAWTLLVESYSLFQFDETYLQALCVMAQYDFYVGNTSRAQAQVAFGLRIAQTSMLPLAGADENFDVTTREESLCRRWEITTSLLILDRMFLGRTTPHATVPITAFSPGYLSSQPNRSGQNAERSEPLPPRRYFKTKQNQNIGDIVAVNVEFFQIFQDVVADNYDSVDDGSKSFWMSDSTRAQILSRLLEIETKIAQH
ncbi:hypothetical protein F5883DRAFT_721256, partial [Diaporthe sp. PMI_573]